MVEDRIPMTREGYDKLKIGARSPAQSRDARGDQTGCYRARNGRSQRECRISRRAEDQGILQARINDLADRLGRAVIIDPSHLPKDSVAFGSKVTVMDLDMDEEETFELVGPGQENPDKGRILSTSPIGQGLIGRKKGETVEIPVPRGTIRFKVLEIAAATL